MIIIIEEINKISFEISNLLLTCELDYFIQGRNDCNNFCEEKNNKNPFKICF